MAGFITLDMTLPDKTWSSANWVFAGFLDHVVSMIPKEADVVHELTVCKYHQNVDLKDIAEENPEMYNRVIEVFCLTCDRIAEGDLDVSVDGRDLDAESQTQYRQAIGELARLLSGLR